MDKFVVKLKRHSSSYETDQGEQSRKFVLTGVRTVGPLRNLLQILATRPVTRGGAGETKPLENFSFPGKKYWT